MASTPASEQIGTVLGGKYRLTRLLGEGGMGRVFAAEHAVLGKEVAVKVLLPQVADNAETSNQDQVRERSIEQIRRALPLAEQIVEHLRGRPGVTSVDYAGSLRRGRDTIGDLDLLACCDDPAGDGNPRCGGPQSLR